MLISPFHPHRSRASLHARLGLLAGLFAFSLGAGAQLNDTGVTATDGGAPAGQDPQFGRDPAAAAGVLPKVGSSGIPTKGFDFTKIANDGSELPDTAILGTNPTDWACTRDNVTGRTWEVKTDDDGLRDQDHTYTWYNPDSTANGGNAGTEDTGAGVGSDNCFDNARCDTQKYTDDVKSAGPCGFSDWRMHGSRLTGASPVLAQMQRYCSISRLLISGNYFVHGS